jgi:SRSO17 transposase
VSGTAEEIAVGLPASRWGRLSAGAGTKGARLDDWAYLELADLDARSVFGCHSARTIWTRGLLIRRGLSDGKMAFFTTWCPKGTPMQMLVEGRRWAIEDAFETAKSELGLAQNETRSWPGWHRHVSLVMLAFAMLMAIRHKAETLTSPQKSPAESRPHPWCDGRSRKSVVLPGV